MRQIKSLRLQALLLSGVAVATLVIGCGSPYRGEVNRLTANGDWQGAIPHLKTAVAQDSTDAWAWRELGRARIGAGRHNEALEALHKADALSPGQGRTLLYIGAANERAGNWKAALGSYERALAGEGLTFGDMNRIRTRLLRAGAEVRRIRAKEIAAQPGDVAPNTIAVYSFTAADTTSPYRALRKGIAAMLITDLSTIRSLTIVERLQLEAILDEIQRSAGDEFDPAMRARAGRLIGAGTSVSGTMVTLPGDEVQLQYVVVDNESGEYDATGESRGEMDEVLRLEKEIAYGVIEQIGVELTADERKMIGRIPTTSFPAFLAWSEGIDHEDRGNYLQAKSKYEQAVQIDPMFKEADDRLEALGGVVAGDQVAMSTDAFLESFDGSAEESAYEDAVDGRLDVSGSIGGDLQDPFDSGVSGGGGLDNTIPPVETGGTGTIGIRIPVRGR